MLAIKVELHPFGDADKAKNIGNLIIWNTGKGTREYGDYGVAVLKEGVSVEEGRDIIRNKALDLDVEIDIEAHGTVKDYPRKLPVWELVTEALKDVGYGQRED